MEIIYFGFVNEFKEKRNFKRLRRLMEVDKQPKKLIYLKKYSSELLQPIKCDYVLTKKVLMKIKLSKVKQKSCLESYSKLFNK